jgi:hypothetical protein
MISEVATKTNSTAIVEIGDSKLPLAFDCNFKGISWIMTVDYDEVSMVLSERSQDLFIDTEISPVLARNHPSSCPYTPYSQQVFA